MMFVLLIGYPQLSCVRNMVYYLHTHEEVREKK